MFRIDLKDVLAINSIVKGTRLKAGNLEDGSDTEPIEAPINPRTCARYLFSESPFAIVGEKIIEGEPTFYARTAVEEIR